MAPHRLIGQSDPGVPSRFVYFHLDHLGSVRAVLDVNGDRVVRHNYLPFGEERPVEADPANPTVNTKHFTGHERDKETGLDYMLARYYSSSLGRFMAVDPDSGSVDHQVPQTWNRFAYVRNNPLARLDRSGTRDDGFLQNRREPSPVAAQVIAGVAQQTSAMANTLGQGSLLGAGGALLAGQPAVAALGVTLAGAFGVVSIIADGVALLASPSVDTLSTVAGDAAAYAVGTKMVNAAGAVDEVGTATQKALSGGLAEAASIPAAGLVTATAGAALGSLQPSATPSSGGDDTSVDRAIADKEARAAKGPEPKKKK